MQKEDPLTPPPPPKAKVQPEKTMIDEKIPKLTNVGKKNKFARKQSGGCALRTKSSLLKFCF